MANSSSSDGSSKAPERFRLTNHYDDDCIHTQNHSEGLVDLLQCPMCCKRQQHFNCRICVKNGNIVHSKAKSTARLIEKQQKYLHLHANSKILSNQYEELVQKHKDYENKQYEIKTKRQQLTLIQQLINKKRQRLQLLSAQRDELSKSNAEKRKYLPKYPIKVKTLEDYVFDRIEKISKLKQTHIKLLDDLKHFRRFRIKQLVDEIFPITEVLKDEVQRRALAERPEEAATIAALADAKNTSYIRGKWVFHGSGICESQYRIVEPLLPANGDYTPYTDWLTDNKHDVPQRTSTDMTPARFEAYQTIGGITLTAQLLQLMSYYLDVRLPYKVTYADFCGTLTEEQFLRKVSRINSNVMYLAYTQHVKLRNLNENHTLENILAILDLERSDLGCYHHHEVTNAPLLQSVDSLLMGIETITESDSEDDNSLRLDWEAVPSMPEITEIAISNSEPTGSQQSTIGEGLMTSAAQRINSLLRWMK